MHAMLLLTCRKSTFGKSMRRQSGIGNLAICRIYLPYVLLFSRCTNARNLIAQQKICFCFIFNRNKSYTCINKQTISLHIAYRNPSESSLKMFVRAIVLCSLVATASAFAPSRIPVRSSSHLSVSTSSPKSNSIFEKAVTDWASQYPAIYNVGWGPTTLAEV
jgi:hypothetical protein